MSASSLLPLLVLWPLAGGLLGLLLPRGAGPLLLGVSTGNLALAVALVDALAGAGKVAHSVGGWSTPLGIALRADGLSAVLILVAGAVAPLLALYASAAYAGRELRYFAGLFLLFLGALNGLFIAGDLFNLYVTLELLGLSAVALAALGGGAAALAASLRYLLATITGSLAYLLGVALLYRATGTLDLLQLSGQGPALPGGAVAFALMVAGLLLKAAVFPLHFWLPPAHANASPPVSAALSALAVKAPLYLLLRLWLSTYDGAWPLVAELLAAIGAAGVLWCSLQAVLQRRAKLLVAYSTVAQLGYLLLALALVPAAGAAAYGAFTLLLVSHVLAKAGLFLAVGNLARRAGHDRLDGFERVVQHLPLSASAIALAGVSLMGMPPSGGFNGKWLLLQAAIATGDWWLVAVILVGGLLAAVYIFKLIEHTFGGSDRPDATALPRRMEWAALTLAASAVGVGFLGQPLLRLLGGVP
ncbi:complex I subunit 5 family protein [Pseudohaliea rubra]|uniref:Putative, Na(+) H(+) antiporter subunit D n=1 Tax=Pseudohaliea rubra DSM 19751 TaxID=1265313 RepID=A0A095VQT2_9GAMM|nr:proton-conducting transporter membrane subunit [Pseudohaliea rubra]KGE03463.1 putative, Na(+) H(+) antiporter subunit D [Pseudohaliea rubra DSM 19751]